MLTPASSLSPSNSEKMKEGRHLLIVGGAPPRNALARAHLPADPSCWPLSEPRAATHIFTYLSILLYLSFPPNRHPTKALKDTSGVPARDATHKHSHKQTHTHTFTHPHTHTPTPHPPTSTRTRNIWRIKRITNREREREKKKMPERDSAVRARAPLSEKKKCLRETRQVELELLSQTP